MKPQIIGQGRQDRWHYFFRVCIVSAILFQLWYFLQPRHLSADPYRHDERRLTLTNWAKHKSPETEAAFHQEIQLLNRHIRNQAVLWLGIFIFADGLGVYFLWNYGNKPVAKPTLEDN